MATKDLTPKFTLKSKAAMLRQPESQLKTELGGFRGNRMKETSMPGSKLKDNATGTAQIDDLSVTLAKLASIVAPTRIVKISGTVTWSGGGATLASTVSGALSTDLVMATIRVKPSEAAYLVSAVPSTNTITFELSAANTSNDAQISYTVFRATS